MTSNKLIEINIKINDNIIATANDIYLIPFSTSLLRTFNFLEVIPQVDNIALEIGDILGVQVNYFHRRNGFEYTNDNFELNVYSLDYSDNAKWFFEGLVTENYRQGVVDIYNLWQKNIELDWFNLPENISQDDYMIACFNYSTIQTNIPTKISLEIDFKLIKTEYDFICAFASGFYDRRSYMGWTLGTFDDCILSIYHETKKYFENFQIILQNTDSLAGERKKLLDEIVTILTKWKFKIDFN